MDFCMIAASLWQSTIIWQVFHLLYVPKNLNVLILSLNLICNYFRLYLFSQNSNYVPPLYWYLLILRVTGTPFHISKGCEMFTFVYLNNSCAFFCRLMSILRWLTRVCRTHCISILGPKTKSFHPMEKNNPWFKKKKKKKKKKYIYIYLFSLQYICDDSL